MHAVDNKLLKYFWALGFFITLTLANGSGYANGESAGGSASHQDQDFGLNILIVGSTHSFSEGGEHELLHQKPFNPATLASHLQGILAEDAAITDTVHVEFEDIYKTQSVTVNYASTLVENFTSHCYSLPQYYFWPEGKATRLANLRGEGDHEWDYIVLCFDPYIMANFPGMVAEGVELIRNEVAQSANPAELVLFAQWPEDTSSFSANQFNEIVYRVGNSAGLTVVPAGKAWDNYDLKDTHSNHPTPKGAYLAAASIYSKLFHRSAKTSGYLYPEVGSAIADHALSVVQANDGVAQYSGTYTSINPFQMKYVTKRVVNYRHTGTSTENLLSQALVRLNAVHRINFNTTGYAGVPDTRWDFNYGRGNDRFEDNKDYEVNPSIYDRSYGFPMLHYTMESAPLTMPYGIDKHYLWGQDYEDGTDLGIAYNMNRPGTRELSLPEDVRAIPIRLLWQKMAEISPGFHPLGDSQHMNAHLNDASAAFMYTLLSGRCPVIDEPASKDSSAWKQWLGHKVGYETAWQMSHLTTRAPAFRVLPSSTLATTVTPVIAQTMTVQFMNQPQADVTVNVSISNPEAAAVEQQTLVFTPSNHKIPQQVTVIGLPGSLASEAFDVVFSTSSRDEVFHGLSDSWSYTNSRNSYTVTYLANASTGGSVPETQIKTQGVALTLAANTGLLARTGYRFAGWNTAANGTGTNYTVSSRYTTDAPLTLYAIWIASTPPLALPLGTATQSSIGGWGGEASLAIDGNTNGQWGQQSVTHTASESNPWWTLDLGVLKTVSQIKIWNRTDTASERLSDFWVFVSEQPFASTDPTVLANSEGVWKHFHSGTVDASVPVPVGTRGRYIRIQIPGDNQILSLAEVQVFEDAASAPPPLEPNVDLATQSQ